MSKANIKICRYINCKHRNREIDILIDDYKQDKRMYYHTDCYKEKCNGEWKDEETKSDLLYIRDRWTECISDTVVYSRLMRILNEYVARGISSQYLAFTLDYVIEHKMNLNYPDGFKYYIDKKEIKDAYAKLNVRKINAQKFTTDVDELTDLDNTVAKNPVFKTKRGFGSILKNDS